MTFLFAIINGLALYLEAGSVDGSGTGRGVRRGEQKGQGGEVALNEDPNKGPWTEMKSVPTLWKPLGIHFPVHC